MLLRAVQYPVTSVVDDHHLLLRRSVSPHIISEVTAVILDSGKGPYLWEEAWVARELTDRLVPSNDCGEEQGASIHRAAKMQRALMSAGGVARRVMQRQPRRGGDSGGSWFGPGTKEGPNGVLFNETPLAPGQVRRWEDWEFPYYFTGIATVIILTVGLSSKPDTRIETWARKQALERIQASGIDDAYSTEAVADGDEA